MSGWTDARLPASGVVLRVRQAGKGPVVLLLHGFPDSCELWNEVMPRLASAGYRVIAPDLRGFGQSDAPSRVGEYAIGHVVADLRTLINRLAGDEPVRVIGHDWGAVAGWCLALEHPQLVRAQVALSVGHPRQYAVAGPEQKLKGLYTLAWQVPSVAERWLAQRNYAGLRGWARQHPQVDACIRDMSRARAGSRPASTGIARTCAACCSAPGTSARCRRSACGAVAIISSPKTRCACRNGRWTAPGATSASNARGTGCRSSSRIRSRNLRSTGLGRH